MIPTEANRFSVAMFLWLNPEGGAALAAFRQAAAPLFQRHGLRMERVLALKGKGAIVGENGFDLPDLFQLVSFADAAAFKAYVSDPDYQALAVGRDAGLGRMVVMTGEALDLGGLVTPGLGEAAARLYGLGLARFQPKGRAGMQAFNEQGQALFARHGMHLEAIIEVAQVMEPIGAKGDFAADRIVLFFLDDGAQLQAYASDPEYAALAPLRDGGLLAYPLFFGGLAVMGGEA